MNYNEYFLKAKELRMKYESLLLCELLFLNYNYYKLKNENIDILKIYNEMKNDIEFSNDEKNIIIENGLKELEDKYNINLN